jgi:hypothetical protein
MEIASALGQSVADTRAAVYALCDEGRVWTSGGLVQGTAPQLTDGVIPPGFPRQIRADGRAWLFTGKVGRDIRTGQASAEYGTDAIRYWRRADGTIEKD